MRRHVSRTVAGVVVLVVIGAAVVALRAEAAPQPPSAEETLKKATADGKYRMLLAQFKAEKDEDEVGAFKDLGFKNRTEYAGQKNLPAGHWVYSAPYWFIWRDKTANPVAKRNWGPEQVTGEPDTQMAGDIVTAWASSSQDNQEEWLLLEYEEAILPTAVLVYETYNPGALVRVTAFKADGEEVELWKGTDPTPSDAGIGVSEVPVKANFKTNRIKVYLDSANLPGWNEIDAVGIRDKAKKIHYAVSCEASSTYASAAPPPTPAELRMQALEEEVQRLRADLDALKKELKKKPQ
jgi:hypothetical protein